VICIVAGLSIWDAERRRRGLELITASVRRDPASAVDPRLKTLNYLGSVLAKREAVLAGVDDALLLSPTGAVAEASVGNVFAFVDGTLRTPPATDGALAGITRDTVLEIARELGIDAREQTLGRIDLLRANEAFLTGTGAGLVGIRSLDGTAIGGERTLCEKLALAYAERARREGVPI
jgi:branched-chain amino acid aminotransferase